MRTKLNRLLHILKIRQHKIDWSSVEIEGVDRADYPDFCDAFFSKAYWDDGTALTYDELDELSNENFDILNQMAFEYCIGE